jgi:hypothetical protein
VEIVTVVGIDQQWFEIDRSNQFNPGRLDFEEARQNVKLVELQPTENLTVNATGKGHYADHISII